MNVLNGKHISDDATRKRATVSLRSLTGTASSKIDIDLLLSTFYCRKTTHVFTHSQGFMPQLSYHPGTPDFLSPAKYAQGFQEANTTNLEDVARYMVQHIWSPCTWRDGRRAKANFKLANILALDFDDGRMTIARTLDGIKKHRLSAIVGTTKSHQKEKKSGTSLSPPCDRFRLLMFYSAPIENKDVYEYNMREAMKLFPCDESCKDAARFFFPCKEIIHVSEGKLIKPKPIPEYYLTEDELRDLQQRKLDSYRENRTMPRWINAALQFGSEEGSRHKMCYKLGANLIQLGFNETEIVSKILLSPLAAIGEKDVRRAVRNGIKRATGR